VGDDLRRRSIRTLAWLGDVAYEREVRWRIARRGDYATERLDAIKSDIVRAEAQAAMLATIEPELTEDELAVARRGRNTSPAASARGRKNTREYREATGFEALVGIWALERERGGWQRFEALVAPRLERAIDEAFARRLQKPKRG